jgi:HEAT repeat protein
MKSGRTTDHDTDAKARRLRMIGLLQIRLSRLMGLVAIVAVLFSAWLFHRENRSDQQAWSSSQILALGDSDSAERRRAAENLYSVEPGSLSRAVAALAVALADPDWQVRRAAARSLPATIRTAIGSSGGISSGDRSADIELAVRGLIPACQDPRDEVRIEARQAVGRLFEARAPGSPGRVPLTTTAAKSALEAMTRGMQDGAPEVRAQAVWSFARVGPFAGAGDDAVRDIAENDPEPKVRIAAVDALSVGWPEDPLLYPLLLRRLKVVTDQVERSRIGWTLGGLAPPPYEVLPALLDALSTDYWVLRRSIQIALGKLGSAARPALPALARVARIELADREDALVAIEAIALIDPGSSEAQALVEPLAAALRDSPFNFQRQQAEFRLVKFGPAAAPAVASLREALKSRSPDVRQRASVVLGRIGSAARSAMPDLASLARDDPNPQVRQSAQETANAIDRSSRSETFASP